MCISFVYIVYLYYNERCRNMALERLRLKQYNSNSGCERSRFAGIGRGGGVGGGIDIKIP